MLEVHSPIYRCRIGLPRSSAEEPAHAPENMLTSGAAHALVTGGAGFIGSHLVDRLLVEGWRVTVIDNMDPFYARSTKLANIAGHANHAHCRFMEGDILEDAALDRCHDPAHPFSVVVHLAAKAGVRPSLMDPMGYHQVNITGTLKLLEAVRRWQVPHFILASSSSIYGEDRDVPWSEAPPRRRPISPYAATKLLAETYAQWYARAYGIKVTALRFFTVFGPRQRPDLAIHQFVHRIEHGMPIVQFGDGSTQRDYTYVADIVGGVFGALGRNAGNLYEIYNLGNSHPVALSALISLIEEVTGKKALIEVRPMQQGDVPRTMADISKARRDLGFTPLTGLREGLEHFVAWYRQR